MKWVPLGLASAKGDERLVPRLVSWFYLALPESTQARAGTTLLGQDCELVGFGTIGTKVRLIKG